MQVPPGPPQSEIGQPNEPFLKTNISLKQNIMNFQDAAAGKCISGAPHTSTVSLRALEVPSGCGFHRVYLHVNGPLGVRGVN